MREYKFSWQNENSIRHVKIRKKENKFSYTSRGIYTCTYAYIYIYTYTHTHTYTHIHIHTYTYIYAVNIEKPVLSRY